MINAIVVPSRKNNQSDVISLACDPIPLVRIGMIGLGVRAMRALKRFIHLEGSEVRAVCDLVEENIREAQNILSEDGFSKIDSYINKSGWKKLCEREDIDLVYICTDWEKHAAMAVYAMQCGKHVAVEVPAATSIKECWALVDVAEQTRRHCMMLENCCYDFFELTTLNMVQEGVLGEVIHAEGAYIHDLRERIFTNEYGKRRSGNWQKDYNRTHTGNPYPTHGLGPICQVMNIHRGDKMNYLVSVSTQERGMSQFANQRFGVGSSESDQNFLLGDMNTTIIKTQMGRTIMIQHNISSPRPYSRIHLLNGIKGYVQKYPIPQMTFAPRAESSLDQKEIDRILKKYEHRFIKEVGEKAIQVCGERAYDYIMDYRLIHCLRYGLPLDMDVYDAAEWSCLVELTEISVLNNSIPVEIPDFTRGEWKKQKGLVFSD